MPRGRRPRTLDSNAIEQELQQLVARQKELRQQLRRMKSGGTGIRKLQEKLEKQLSTAKWTVQQIHQIDPNWDDAGFYRSVRARQPAPRGRRKRSEAGEGAAA